MTFRLLLGLDGLAALAALYFFAADLADGPVSVVNGGLWAGLLLGVAAVLVGPAAAPDRLPAAGERRAGAAGGADGAVRLFLAVVIGSGARWN